MTVESTRAGGAAEGRGAAAAPGLLTAAALAEEVAAGRIDTVVVAATDMQGRLVGKRVQGEFFCEETVEEGIEGCAYLLATDMGMNPVPGYELVHWDQGYGDFRMVPDLSTLRRIPWLEGTALVLCDVVAVDDGSPLAVSPRRILAERVEHAARLGFEALAATELEFFLYADGYDEARRKDYRDLRPTTPYLLDYHVLATTFHEPFIRQVRRGMQGAGIPVESSKGEAAPNQHEINLRYADALTTADRHVIYKNGVKELAHLNGLAATFMAKPYDGIGSSCHVHGSLRGADGGPSAFVDADGGETAIFRHYIGGLCRHARELALLLAPTVNSYKRYTSQSWAPTAVAWGRDNRTCAFRVVGHGQSTRVECRLPGADVNPYLGVAALLAAGLDGIEHAIEPPEELRGDGYTAGGDPFPGSLHAAIDAWQASAFARETFGEVVWRHYLNYARREQGDFEAVVTDYERRRMFELG